MSRNDKLREVAAKLPSLPKLNADNKGIYDQFGRILYVDHFAEMVRMKNEYPMPHAPMIRRKHNEHEESFNKRLRIAKKATWDMHHKIEIQVIGTYTQKVQQWEFKRKQRIRMWWYKTASIIASSIMLAFYIYTKLKAAQ